MFPTERRQKIAELLEDAGRVTVDDLTERFHVTADTIRKDLAILAKKGLCQREYGGATALYPTSDTHDVNPLSHEDEMRLAVARRAYSQIDDGDSIFLDISRTNLFLADYIAGGDKTVLVTTNMPEIPPKLSDNPKVTALLTGGILNVRLDGYIGSATVSLLEPLLFAKAFVGAYGVELDTQAVTALEEDDALVKEQVIKNASRSYLLADRGKFENSGGIRFATITDFSGVITDCRDEQVVSSIERIGVPVINRDPAFMGHATQAGSAFTSDWIGGSIPSGA